MAEAELPGGFVNVVVRLRACGAVAAVQSQYTWTADNRSILEG